MRAEIFQGGLMKKKILLKLFILKSIEFNSTAEFIEGIPVITKQAFSMITGIQRHLHLVKSKSVSHRIFGYQPISFPPLNQPNFWR